MLQLIEVSIGMPAPVNLVWLDLKFRGLAAELVLSADRYSGRDLVERGIAARVVPEGEVLSAARDYADRLAAHPGRSLVAAKQTMRALDGIEHFGDRVKAAQATWREASGQYI